jgi:anti-sigma factor RsiW
MTHLGDRVSALVDGELSHAERDRALAHLAGCAQCRAEVESERQVKATIRAQVPPALPAGLVTSLRRLAEPGEPLPPEHPWFPDRSRTSAPWRPVDRRPQGRPGTDGVPGGRPATARRSRLGHRVRLVGGGVLVAAAATVGLALLGGTDEDAPPVVPPVEQLTVEHARTSQTPPFADSTLMVEPALLRDRAPVTLPGSSAGPDSGPNSSPNPGGR